VGAVTQPSTGGPTVPVLDAGVTSCSDKNIQACLNLVEGNATNIEAQQDALIAPEVFTPTCRLTFKPIAKGGGDSVAFGWYNIKPDPSNAGKFLRPTQAELYGMFTLPWGNTPNDRLDDPDRLGPNPEATLDLDAEALAGRYKGGDIGFFLIAGKNFEINATTRAITPDIDPNRLFLTQHDLNPGSTGGASVYYQVLTWQSITHDNSFYFGWEDQQASASSDNDFDDLVFLVSGIQCSGGGEACMTGKPGVCGPGTLQCKKGELECVQSIPEGPEECNALDDDCNGMIDDGDLCEKDYVCHRGRCQPKCNTGEFKCDEDLVCVSGVCIELACKDKVCPEGQVCKAGACVDSCMGVTCPFGRKCFNGACIDPCVGIECDAGFACVLGVCKSCECTECGAGELCKEQAGATAGTETYQCVETACETVSCMPGTHCVAGACVNNCANAVCPTGQTCDMTTGECVVDPSMAPTGGSSGIPDPPPLVPDPDNTGNNGGSSASGGSSSSSGGQSPPTLSSGDSEESDSGCGCSIPQQSRGRELFGLLVLAGLALRRWSRRAAA
jgi:MYXO-CTERM domain-containing protein